MSSASSGDMCHPQTSTNMALNIEEYAEGRTIRGGFVACRVDGGELVGVGGM